MNPANIELLTLTVSSVTEQVTANQLVAFDGGPCGADEPVMGIAHHNAATGKPLAVVSLGVCELIAATAIATGDAVYSDTDGSVTAVGENNSFGRAITGGAQGDIIAILIR